MYFLYSHRLSLYQSIYLLLFVLSLLACTQSSPPDNLVEGQAFPSLTLVGLNTDNVFIDDLAGKIIVLNVWATWCGPCRYELPSLNRLHQVLNPNHFAVMALSVDKDLHVVREYLNDIKVTLPVYIDQEMSIANDQLGIRIYPDTFVLSTEGTLLKRFVGDEVWDHQDMIHALKQAYKGDVEQLKAF